jgi:uncharacterized protein YndB with AHSA1/START domain
VHDPDGVLERDGDRWRLRFTRRLPHAPDKVWRALTEPESLKAWFPDRIVISEWAVGAPLQFGNPLAEYDGEVLAFEPPKLIEFRWGPDRIRLEIAPDGDGSVFTLLDTIDELGKAARDAAGWHECLDNLEQHLAGAAPSWQPGDRWRAVHGTYVDRFGPEGATIGPPEGWEDAAALQGRQQS